MNSFTVSVRVDDRSLQGITGDQRSWSARRPGPHSLDADSGRFCSLSYFSRTAHGPDPFKSQRLPCSMATCNMRQAAQRIQSVCAGRTFRPVNGTQELRIGAVSTYWKATASSRSTRTVVVMDTSIRQRAGAQPDGAIHGPTTSGATSEITPLKRSPRSIRRQFYGLPGRSGSGAPGHTELAPDGTISVPTFTDACDW